MPKYDADRIQEIKRRLPVIQTGEINHELVVYQNDLNFKDAPYLLDVIEELRAAGIEEPTNA